MLKSEKYGNGSTGRHIRLYQDWQELYDCRQAGLTGHLNIADEVKIGAQAGIAMIIRLKVKLSVDPGS